MRRSIARRESPQMRRAEIKISRSLPPSLVIYLYYTNFFVLIQGVWGRKINFCLTVRSKICPFAKFGSIGRGAACCSRLKNVEFVQKSFNKYTNSYKCANPIFMYSREEQAPPLPQNPISTNRQDCKQKFIIPKIPFSGKFSIIF